jgi:hypothetical protein
MVFKPYFAPIPATIESNDGFFHDIGLGHENILNVTFFSSDVGSRACNP